MTRRFVEREPDCVSVGDVVQFLERHERHDSVALVRGLAAAAERDAKLYAALYRDYQTLYERLLKYEPRQTHEPCTGVPPPESSD
jgi:hypothetical protein